MFLKFHGSILSEIVLSAICLEQKGLNPPIKKLYHLNFKLRLSPNLQFPFGSPSDILYENNLFLP